MIKQIGKKILKAVAPSWFRSLSDARAERHCYKVMMSNGLPAISSAIISRYGAKVIGGPFAGMHYISSSSGSVLAPKLIGSYECELHDAIISSLKKQYDTIIDVGCAEGYYAAGFAKFCCGTPRIYAFDSNSKAQAKCRELLRENILEERVEIEGFCDAKCLQRIAHGRTLVICDCEGYEIELLKPEIAHDCTAH